MSATAHEHGLLLRARIALGELQIDVDLAVARGETVAIVGPNGAGKSTLLRAIAGLVALDAGRISLGDDVLDDPSAGVFVVPERRRVGIVFQQLLLFPHLSALDNVAFGLEARGESRAEARHAAAISLERFGVAHRASHRPLELSGGEAQRVALARTLALDPTALLLDEPLSAVDAGARGVLRRDLRRHLQEHAGPSVIVTHDPIEAIALADRLLVLEDGRMTQQGTAAEIAARPRSEYVARLVGVNLLRGDARDHTVDLEGGGALTLADTMSGPVLLAVHPRAISLYRERPAGTPRNVWRVRVTGLDRHAERVRVLLAGPPDVIAEVTHDAVSSLALATGTELWAVLKATEIDAFTR
jgi:molybdate transport system ATP-binding protein